MRTLEVISALAQMRRDGIPAYFTLDAGPNPVVLTDAAHEKAVINGLRVDSVVRCQPGGDARLS